MPSAPGLAIDVDDRLQVVGGLVRLAAHVGHEQAGALVVVVAQAGVLGQAGVDQLPIQPAAGIVAEDRGQDLRGVAVGVGGRGPVGQLQHVLQRGGFLVHALESRCAARPAASRGRLRTAPTGRKLRSAVATSASKSTRPAATTAMLPRAVALLEVARIASTGRCRDALDRAQHAAAQRMAPKCAALHLSSAPNGGWSSYIWISSMITFFSVSKSSSRSDGRMMSAKQLDRRGLILGQHRRVVDRVFFAGEGVVVGAHLVELAVHVFGRARGRALEHHVLEEMAHAGDFVGFVARAGLHEEAQRRRMGVVIALGDDFQTVVQRVLTKLQSAPPSGLGPSVTIVKSRGGCSAR